MKFIDALKLLLDGKKIRGKNWDSYEYIHIMNDRIYGEDMELYYTDYSDYTIEWEEYKLTQHNCIIGFFNCKRMPSGKLMLSYEIDFIPIDHVTPIRHCDSIYVKICPICNKE